MNPFFKECDANTHHGPNDRMRLRLDYSCPITSCAWGIEFDYTSKVE